MTVKRNRTDPLERRVTAYARMIRELREDHDLSQKAIADLLGIRQRTYADYELGKIRVPIDSLIVLAEYYDVDMNYICGLTLEKAHFRRTRRELLVDHRP